MEAGRHPGDGLDPGRVQFATGQYPIKQAFLVETAHFDGVFECARRVDGGEDGRLGATRERDDVQIQLRGEASVEAQFLLAVMASQIQGREIQKAQVQGLLELVGVVAGEQDDGDMGLQGGDPVHCMGIGPGCLQGLDERLLNGVL